MRARLKILDLVETKRSVVCHNDKREDKSKTQIMTNSASKERVGLERSLLPNFFRGFDQN